MNDGHKLGTDTRPRSYVVSAFIPRTADEVEEWIAGRAPESGDEEK